MMIETPKKQPVPNSTKPVLGSVVFSNVRESKLKKSMRVRQCFNCEGKIKKGETYISHQFRYDYRIITVSFCNNCT